MAILEIPKVIKTGLLRINSLTNEQFQELQSALENLPPKIKQGTIFDYADLKIETIEQNVVTSIRDALYPVYIAQGTTDRAVSRFVDDIIESLEEEITQKEDITNLRERLTRLFDLERPKLIAKAHDVLIGQKPTYSEGRIFTDLRPVFADDIETTPQAAVIVQVLRITYYKDRIPKEFVVALDTKDIQELINTLERAKKKAETLRSVISSDEMKIIDVV